MNANPLPKPSLRRKFHEAGLDRKTNVLLSAAYMLHSVAYGFYDEADEILKENGIRMSLTKQLNDQLRRAYNAYFRDFSELIERTDAERKNPADRTCKKDYFRDIDRYTPILSAVIQHIFATDEDVVIKELETIGIKIPKTNDI